MKIKCDQTKPTRAASLIPAGDENEDVIADVIADIIKIDQWTSCHFVILYVTLASAADGGKHGRCENGSVLVGPMSSDSFSYS